MKLCFLFRQITRNLLFLSYFLTMFFLLHIGALFLHLLLWSMIQLLLFPSKILSLLLLALLKLQSHPLIFRIITAMPLFHNPLLFCILFPVCLVMINFPLLIVPWFMLSFHMLNPLLLPKLLKFQSGSKLCKQNYKFLRRMVHGP